MLETPDSGSSHGDRSRPRPPRPRLSHRMQVLASVALGFAIAILLILPVFSTLQPGYYGRYPDLRMRMQNWGASTHAKMSCVDCHVDPGTSSMLSFGGRSIPAFYSQLLFGPKDTNLLGAPDRSACQKCHTDYRQVSPNGDLLIPHRAHVEVLKIQCVFCHKDLVHSKNDKGYNSPEMSTCLKCHDGVKAKNACSACHTRKEVPDGHKKADWLSIHGSMTKTIDCAKCHNWTPNYCGDCHRKRPPSHVGNWKKTHGTDPRAKSGGCLVCHSMAKFCKNCH